MAAAHRSIACSLYDALEASAVRGARVVLRLAKGNTGEEHIVCVTGLFLGDKQQFFVARDKAPNEDLVGRLDSVVGITDLLPHTTYSGNAC